MNPISITGTSVILCGHPVHFQDFQEVASPHELETFVTTKVAPFFGRVPKTHQDALATRIVGVLYAKRLTFRFQSKHSVFAEYAFTQLPQIASVLRSIPPAVIAAKAVAAEEKALHAKLNSAAMKVAAIFKAKRKVRASFLNAQLGSIAKQFKRMAARAEASKVFSPQELLVARSLLSQLTDPIAIMLGLLRVIPLSNRQRDIEFFEGFFGLNGRIKLTLEQLGKKHRVTWATPQKAIDYIWHKLAIAKSPITDPEHLQRLLDRIQAFEKTLREPILISPLLPSESEQIGISLQFAVQRETQKLAAKDRPYQLQFVEFKPVMQDTWEETMVFIVCQVFGLTLKQLKSLSSLTKISRARYIAAYLLDVDLKISPQRIGRLIGRGADMARYGRYHTARAIAEKQDAVIYAVETIRRLYRGLK